MSSIWGSRLKLSLFGESHGQYIGGVLDGLPSGVPIDMQFVSSQMYRRAAKGGVTTKRLESDEVSFVSGVTNGFTNGSPICVVIENTAHDSSEYTKLNCAARPSHADYTAHVKYKAFNDMRGGGHLSGRLTAPLVALASICQAYLKGKNVTVKASLMQSMQLIEQAHKNCDSIGGKVQCVVQNMPVGAGNPIFDNVESTISSILFAIPGVKAVEFGAGVEFSSLTGSSANDSLCNVDGKIVTSTNNSGGINGGISNGMPIVVTATFRPTPSIPQQQDTVNYVTGENVKVTINGRHDSCIAVRGEVCVEAAVSVAICQLLLLM